MTRTFLLVALYTFITCILADECFRHYPHTGGKLSFVCVCTQSKCTDALEPLDEDALERPGKAWLYRTSIGGDRLVRYPLKARRIKNSHYRPRVSAERLVLSLNASVRYQSILGFGGAMTDAAAINIHALPAGLRERLLEDYFGRRGLGYNMIRVPMASCDFSTREYSYAEQPGDFNMTHFSIAPEDGLKIYYLLKAQEIAEREKRRIKVFGSPWSAPGWMKQSGKMTGAGFFKGGHNYSTAYAKYFVKFIESYAMLGVPIWAVTVQNEPSTGRDPAWRWQTMWFPPKLQKTFVRDFLKPAFRQSAAARRTKIMIHDDFRDRLPKWVDLVLSDPEADRAVDGIAVHWYNDRSTPPERLDQTFKRHPGKFILATEACYTRGPILGDFHRALGYARDIIEDLNHFVAGWVDWNLAVDKQGGPNYVSNFVDSPIIVDIERQKYFKQPMFHVMGQFSRFILPGAVRVSLLPSSPSAFGDVSSTALLNPDGSVVVVILNDRGALVKTEIRDARTRVSLQLPPRSVSTVLFRPFSPYSFG